MKQGAFWLSTVFAGSLLAAGGALAQEDEHDGKALFVAKNCNLCHSVQVADIEKKSERIEAPDLSTMTEEAGSEESLVLFLKGEEELDGTKHRQKFKGTDEELEAIVDWLMVLQKETERSP